MAEVTIANENERLCIKDEKELILKASADLQKDIECNLFEKGCGRALLNGFCLKHKWTGPKYELLPQGQGHVGLFIFSASIHGPLGIIKCMGDPMPRKTQAKDNVAAKILMTLRQFFSS